MSTDIEKRNKTVSVPTKKIKRLPSLSFIILETKNPLMAERINKTSLIRSDLYLIIIQY